MINRAGQVWLYNSQTLLVVGPPFEDAEDEDSLGTGWFHPTADLETGDRDVLWEYSESPLEEWELPFARRVA